MKKGIVAVVQARMDSKRFPGKTLAKIGDWTLIELVLRRVNNALKVDHTVLATSVNSIDDVLADHVKQLGFQVFRGSEEDVLLRFYNAAQDFIPSVVVRITGDCPLISPKLIDLAVDAFLTQGVDYLSISIGEQKERAYPRGFDVEVAKFESLSLANQKATEKYEREHVMPYLYTHPELFTVSYLDPEPENSRPRYRLCVDTPQDFQLILRIHEHFEGKLIDVDFQSIIKFLDKHPDLVSLNQSVKQKHFSEVDTNIE